MSILNSYHFVRTQSFHLDSNVLDSMHSKRFVLGILQDYSFIRMVDSEGTE